MTATALIRIAGLMLAAALIMTMTACDLRRDGAGDNEHVLRVHDVSNLQSDQLDVKLSLLLASDDLPLRGNVRVIDQGRLAVNGSRYLQDQIARLLADLDQIESSDAAAIERDFRLQFWLLTLVLERDDDALPPVIDDLADVIRDQFPQHGIRVHDFIETFGGGSTQHVHLVSGGGTNVSLSPLRLLEDGAHISGRIFARAPEDARGQSATFNLNRTIRAGQTLMLGRSHGGTIDDQAFYQVLVARMDWTD
ncbi:MAG: hypothetical protein EA419_11390 [Wenzhouxiangella sp.]|nr:MAG: hypothetical protein EA419_11390 [Wenzhouxiangella sp.]